MIISLQFLATVKIGTRVSSQAAPGGSNDMLISQLSEVKWALMEQIQDVCYEPIGHIDGVAYDVQQVLSSPFIENLGTLA